MSELIPTTLVLSDKRDINQKENIFTQATCVTDRLVEAITIEKKSNGRTKYQTVYFLTLKNVSGVKIEWNGAISDEFKAYFWNSLTCPVRCYHEIDMGTPLDKNPIVQSVKSTMNNTDEILSAVRQAILGTHDDKIKKKDYISALANVLNQAEEVKSAHNYPRTGLVGTQTVFNCLGIEKACSDQDTTKIRSLSDFSGIFLQENHDPIKTGFPDTFNRDHMSTVVQGVMNDVSAIQLEVSNGNYTRYNENLLYGTIKDNLVAMTLVMRHVQDPKTGKSWDWCKSKYATNLLDCDIDNLSVFEINFQESLIPENVVQFFFPKDPEDKEKMLDDMEKVWKLFKEEQNSSIVCILMSRDSDQRDESYSYYLRCSVKPDECPPKDRKQMEVDKAKKLNQMEIDKVKDNEATQKAVRKIEKIFSDYERDRMDIDMSN